MGPYKLKQFMFQTCIALKCRGGPGALHIKQYTFEKCIVFMCKVSGSTPYMKRTHVFKSGLF